MSPCGSCNSEGAGVRRRRGSCNSEGAGVQRRRGSCNSETYRSVEAVRYVSEARGGGSEAPWKRVGSASDVRNMRFFDFHGGFVGDVGRMASHLRGLSTRASSSRLVRVPRGLVEGAYGDTRAPVGQRPLLGALKRHEPRPIEGSVSRRVRGCGRPIRAGARDRRGHTRARGGRTRHSTGRPPARRGPEPPCVRRLVVGAASPGAPLCQPGSPRRDERVSGASPLLSRSLAESAWSALTRPLVKLTSPLVNADQPLGQADQALGQR